MANKISKFVFLILLFLLQSCSGGKIGNFLESSFKNNNSNKISQNDFDKKSKISITYKDKKLVEKKEKNTKIKLDESIKPLNIVNSFSPNTNTSGFAEIRVFWQICRSVAWRFRLSDSWLTIVLSTIS